MNQIKKLPDLDDLPAKFRGSRLLPGTEAYGKSRAIFNMRWRSGFQSPSAAAPMASAEARCLTANW